MEPPGKHYSKRGNMHEIETYYKKLVAYLKIDNSVYSYGIRSRVEPILSKSIIRNCQIRTDGYYYVFIHCSSTVFERMLVMNERAGIEVETWQNLDYTSSSGGTPLRLYPDDAPRKLPNIPIPRNTRQFMQWWVASGKKVLTTDKDTLD
jgi:hypothetical protein